MSNILEVHDIHTYIGQFHILEGVSVSVPEGSITVLLGRNGAGKTTTLKSIMGITPPTRGTIQFKGETLAVKLTVASEPPAGAQEVTIADEKVWLAVKVV